MVDPVGFSWVSNLKDSTKADLVLLARGLAPDQRFEVREKNNVKTLKVVNNSFFSNIAYFFTKKSKDYEVKHLINQSIVDLMNGLPEGLDDTQKKEIQDLFLARLATLPQELFDRRVLGDAGIDKKALVKILNPNLDKQVDDYTSDTERKLERRVEKAKLAAQLGIDLKLISIGASGSYFVRDHKLKIIGVFKPGQEESTGMNTPKKTYQIWNQVRSFFGTNDKTFWPGTGYISEAMSSQLAEHMNLDVVPRSIITSLESRQFESAKNTRRATTEVGSFQIFASNTQSADEKLKLNSRLSFSSIRLKFNAWRYEDKIVQKINQSDFEMMAMMDGLILNRDRHFENWLMKNDPSGDGTHKIVLIDNQMGFPIFNPPKSDSEYRRQQNKWEILKSAEQPFSDEIKLIAESQLQGSNLNDLLVSLQQKSLEAKALDPNVQSFKDMDANGSSQEFAFKQRVAVLLIAQDQKLTIREHAALKSLDEMKVFARSTIDITNEAALNDYLKLLI